MLNRYYKYQFYQFTGKTRPVKALVTKVQASGHSEKRTGTVLAGTASGRSKTRKLNWGRQKRGLELEDALGVGMR